MDATIRSAIGHGLREALEIDDRVLILGEDVGAYGGSYAVTRGFLDDFGDDRIRDCPLSESGFVGAAIGAAMGGLKPFVEVMTVNFALLAFDQIANNAASLSHMSGGQVSVPVCIRMATGAGRQLAAQHSHSWECLFAHIPGLLIFEPSTVQDAYDVIMEAYHATCPTLIFENVALYQKQGELDKTSFVPGRVRQSRLAREGSDLTLVSYGNGLEKCLHAAKELSLAGIDAEVIDLRILRPLDFNTMKASIQKTNKVMVVDEASQSISIASEIVAAINDLCFYDLDAPPVRICAKEVPIPYPAHLEAACLPQVDNIVQRAKEFMADV